MTEPFKTLTAVACPIPDTTKNTIDNKPSWAKDQPNSFMNTGNMTGSSRCEKCELACASPTKPITAASRRHGTWEAVIVVMARL